MLACGFPTCSQNVNAFTCRACIFHRLREQIQTENAVQRQFLVNWIAVMASVPGIDLLRYLPSFLEGLFKILCDDNFEIRRTCEDVLDTFLARITTAKNTLDYPINYPAMTEILIRFCGPSKHLLSKFMAVTWLREFIELAYTQILPWVGQILQAVQLQTPYAPPHL